MKKTYQQPVLTVTKLNVVVPLAGSPTGGTVYGTQAASGASGLSREENAWGDIWGNSDYEED